MAAAVAYAAAAATANTTAVVAVAVAVTISIVCHRLSLMIRERFESCLVCLFCLIFCSAFLATLRLLS